MGLTGKWFTERSWVTGGLTCCVENIKRNPVFSKNTFTEQYFHFEIFSGSIFLPVVCLFLSITNVPSQKCLEQMWNMWSTDFSEMQRGQMLTLDPRPCSREAKERWHGQDLRPNYCKVNNKTQHHSTKHNTTQHNTTQHNTIQHNLGRGGELRWKTNVC